MFPTGRQRRPYSPRGQCLLWCLVIPALLRLLDSTDGTPVAQHDHVDPSQLAPIAIQNDQQRLANQRSSGLLCPGVPTQISDLIGCREVASVCVSDEDCSDTKRICCFNGCIFTCLQSISPPPALDWLEEPPLNSIELHNASSENEGFVSCSTTVRRLPAHVHSCPEGFRCNIFEAGDPISGAPNKGMCVAEPPPDSAEEKFVGDDDAFHASSTKETVFLPGGCLLTNGQYDDLESFLKGGHYSSCQCQQGSVQCKVSYNSTLVIDLPDDSTSSPPTSFTIIEGSLLEEDIALPMD